MAGDWIPMRLDLMEDPAVMQMAHELGVRDEVVVGYCHAFWCWVSRQMSDGCLTGVPLLSIERRLNLPGFLDMLCKVGWLEYDDAGPEPILRIPNFDRWLSESAKKRLIASHKKRLSRAKRDKSGTNSGQKWDKSGTKVGTTVQDSTEECTLSLSVFGEHEYEVRQAVEQWKEYRFLEDGKAVNSLQLEQQVMTLAQSAPHERAAAIVMACIREGKPRIFPDVLDRLERQTSRPRRNDSIKDPDGIF